MHPVRVRIVRVVANPATASSKTCPLSNKPIKRRSTKYFWPTTTREISFWTTLTHVPPVFTSSVSPSVQIVIKVFCYDATNGIQKKTHKPVTIQDRSDYVRT